MIDLWFAKRERERERERERANSQRYGAYFLLGAMDKRIWISLDATKGHCPLEPFWSPSGSALLSYPDYNCLED